MEIPKENLVQLWYENEAGERYYPTEEDMGNLSDPPEGFIYQHALFASQLVHEVLLLERDEHGIKSSPLATGHSTYPGELAIAMALSDYTFDQAVLIAAQSCERCLNALMHKYLTWFMRSAPRLNCGYPESSPQYQESHTRCQFCDPSMRPKVVQLTAA